MADALVLLESRPGGVALLTLNRPPLNALSTALMAELGEHVATLTADPSVKAVVVTGNEKAFAAGADVSEFTAGGAAAIVGGALRHALDALAAVPRPVLAAISGFALGGGLELALACDLGSRPTPRAWACLRSNSASSRVRVARSACRGSWARPGRRKWSGPVVT